MEKGILVNKAPITYERWNVWTGLLLKDKYWKDFEMLQQSVSSAFEGVDRENVVDLAEALQARLDFVYEPKGGLVLVTDHVIVYSVVWGEALGDHDVKGEILSYLFETGELW